MLLYDQLLSYVKAQLKLGWSLEQIAAESLELTGASISKEDLRPYLARSA